MLTLFRCMKKIIDWGMPPLCILCQQLSDCEQDLCSPCRADMPILPQTCPRCAKTLSSAPFPCGNCQQSPPPYDAAHALFSYQKPITKLIMELKFHAKLINAKILGEWMAATIKNNWYQDKPLPALIIPMPLHAQRLKERGFNQSQEIGRPIARLLKIPLDNSLCMRIKATDAQAMLPAAKRIQNIKNAFHIRQDLSGRHIALLDDVTTTGASMAELARSCKKAGAAQIDAWFCARAVFADF
jgi:ComF family protein